MVDYTKSTGTSGTMIIRDSGGKVSFLLKNSSSQTYAYGKSWSGTVNGNSVGGTYDISPNQTKTLGTWTVSSSQTVTFKIGSSGTSGLGGPTTFSHSISRSSLPGAPGTPTVSNIGTTTADLAWSAAASNGSAIVNYGWQVASDTAFTKMYASGDTGTGRSAHATGLIPAGQFYARVFARNGVGRGPASGTRSFVTDPSAPTSMTLGSPTTTTLRASWSNGNNGSQFTAVQLQYDSNSSFSSPQTRNLGKVTSYTITGLATGDQFWARARTRNSAGVYSGWSNVATGSTLGTAAPTLVVAPSLDGSSAKLTITPPPGATPTSYRIERRPTGGGTTSTYNTSSTTYTVSPLTPGASYDWRVSAFVGSYQSPWSAWQTKVQPNPSTNAGDYFDGSTTDRTDVNFNWGGTANNSISTASSSEVLGWGSFDSGSDDSGGSGVITRTSSGRSGSFSARVTFFSDTTAAGFHAGLDRIDGVAVTSPGIDQSALIHVRLPGRSQRLAAMLLWVDADSNVLGREVGEGKVVQSSSSEWTELSVAGIAPDGAAGVAVRAIDVEGNGWSPWLGGDVMLIDDAITPFSEYYFDGDTSDTTRYTYSWEGTVNNSPSVRNENDVPEPDPLLDPDCPPIPDPPRPPIIDDSCAETDVTEWRRMVASIGDGEWANPEWLDLIPTLAISATTDVRLLRIRYYQNPFNRELSDLDMDNYCSEQIITFIPSGAILTLDGISERVWAEVSGSSDSLAADHLLATQQGDIPQWPILGCGSDYYVTVDVPVDIPAGSVDVEYTLTARYR